MAASIYLQVLWVMDHKNHAHMKQFPQMEIIKGVFIYKNGIQL